MGKKRQRNPNRINFYKNDIMYLKWYRKLKKIAVSRFKWENLPSTIDERYLELCLFERGMSVFFYEKGIGFLALQCTIQGMLNVYNIPIKRLAYANNGFHRNLNEKNSVIIYNDYMHSTGEEEIIPYAYDLYVCNSVKNININAQKTPILIQGPESQRLTLENLYMQYDGNKPVIKGTEDLNLSQFTVLKTDAPFVADKLQILQAEIWNEAMTALGVPNVAQNKRSSLMTDEVERMQGGAFSSRYSALNMREQAVKQINEMFGLDIKVSYRLDSEDVFEPYSGIKNETGLIEQE